MTRSIQNLHLLALNGQKLSMSFIPASADNFPGDPVTESPRLAMAGNNVQEHILVPTLVRPCEWQVSKGLS